MFLLLFGNEKEAYYCKQINMFHCSLVGISSHPMGIYLCLLFILASIVTISAQEVKHATLVVEGAKTVAETDDNFICATIDWWPHDKCNYNQCPWGYSSVLNMDLSQPLLAKAIQAFGRLRIRIGGSLQDQVLYEVGNIESPCHSFQKLKDGLFGFSKGCLQMNRWDELNHFLNRTGALVTFGLNALHGRHQIKKGAWGGAWDSTNVHDFIDYTVSKRYHIDSWEFGNELSGKGIGASVDAETYGKDIIKLKSIINNLYINHPSKPSLVAPGGFFNQEWYCKLLQVSGSGVLDVMTHHMYNLGPGVDPNLMKKILDPKFLDRASATFTNVSQTLQKNGPWAVAWVGESGGAYNSGGRHISNRFVDSFWYLDQLGMSSNYNTKVYCRQTLIGGNYGLLNTTTLAPNPDYYSALLWNQLMGKQVLGIHSDASPFLRAYAHCSKATSGITLLLINMSNQTDFIVSVGSNHVKSGLNLEKKNTKKRVAFSDSLKKSVSWIGRSTSDGTLFREEYHLTPKDGNLQSQTMVLNGTPLQLTNKGNIPKLDPVRLDVNSPLYLAPLSIAFIVFPNFDAPACT